MGGERKSRILGSLKEIEEFRPTIPVGAVTNWETLGRMPTGPGGLVAGMPGCPLPGEHDFDDLRLVGPGPDADVSLQVVRAGTEFVRVAAVKVVFAEGEPDADEFAGNAVIDTGSMMIAEPTALQAIWKVGGPLCRTNIILGKHGSAAAAPLKNLLRADGLRISERTGISDDFIEFDVPPNDSEIRLVRRRIAETGLKVRLNAWQHQTGEEIEQSMRHQLVAMLTKDDRPYAFVFPTGWGDGLYPWKRLLRQGNVIGYLCDFELFQSGD